MRFYRYEILAQSIEAGMDVKLISISISRTRLFICGFESTIVVLPSYIRYLNVDIKQTAHFSDLIKLP